MRSAIVIGALVGLAASSPLAKRQGIEFDQVDAADVPDLLTPPVEADAPHGSYDAAAAVASAASDPVTSDTDSATKVKRSACQPQPSGYGPNTSPDDKATFLADPKYPSMANAANVPDGYTLAFSALNGATQSSSYITYKTLKSYDPYACQQFCDKEANCYFYNIYMERDPTVEPADGCRNPASTINIKCSLWGSHETNTTATNTGQGRYDFQVAIAGSNGYNKVADPAAQSGFTGPIKYGGAINAPDNSYIGYKYYPGPYNPAQCAVSCQATTAYNSRHKAADGSYDTCSFFNAYVLSKNGAPQGTYCSMYTKTWSPDYAVNYGQYRGSDRYTVSQSYGYILNQSS